MLHVYMQKMYIYNQLGASRKPIPIKHRLLDIRESHYQRDNWAIGDNFLDWDDQPEANQTAIGDGVGNLFDTVDLYVYESISSKKLKWP